jgi:acetyl esterase/lipase
MGYNSLKRKFLPFNMIIFVVNIAAFILGAVYLLFGTNSVFWNIYGFLMLIVLLCNIAYAYFNCKFNHKGHLYLSLSTLFMIIIPIFNMLVSFSPTHQSSRSIISCAAIFILFALGGFMAGQNIFKKKTEVELFLLQITDKYENEPKNKKRRRITLIILLSFVLFIGLTISYGILVINRIWRTDVFLSAFGLFYAYLFLSVGILIITLLRKKDNHIKLIYLAITMIVFISCLVPVFSIPSFLRESDISYSHGFSEDYKSNPDFNNAYFRKVKFSIPEYFFGTVSKDYTVKKDIPFYFGVDGVDKDLILYFDVYGPKNDADMLPGGNSVLIRIHGGEWKYGDKGFLNSAQMNKYFASQGYVVFDIQYGLSKINNKLPVWSWGKQHGDYTVDDMVRHIGIFLKYLADNHKQFNANIDSVLISGSSAGGNLALATAIAHESGKYPNIADPRIIFKGIIPFYPANGLAQNMGLEASEEFSNPGINADYHSPPCLVFQGTHDGLVSPEVSNQVVLDNVNGGNKKCSIIYMPYGGHSCDIYFSGYYNQVLLYYMERFMFQYR